MKRKLSAVVLILGFFFLFLSGCSNIFQNTNFWEANSVQFLDKQTCSIFFLDVGQGDSILIKTPGNKFVLIDSGPNSAEQDVLQTLDRLNVKKLDVVIATHPHEDHIGNMDKIISKYDIERFYTTNKTANTQTFEDMLNALRKKNLKISIARPFDRLMLNGVTLTFLSPLKDYDDLNDSSVVVMLEFAGKRVLFTGDISKDVEYDIIKKAHDIKADVLKVSHHGSYAATSSLFLKNIDPKVGIISVGKNNPYGHPHSSTIRRLKKFKVKIFTTEQNGNIVVQIFPDGTIKLITQR
ncbi:ComEC/Rec2 family competence protein [Anaerocellum danielii]|uniref:ComEC/Rec2 family competence protein n=1 Tax=Anaerocellum danielii TaxID=1387557 RepID=A0ABZ0U2I9_9FIRM|nr:ComEC/Rec2 family competence protein [Caldicellulosiruptor danielii]WPX09938.1 ComEC/Rec2 family competence protein [Caldicellulosiruptor danielii]